MKSQLSEQSLRWSDSPPRRPLFSHPRLKIGPAGSVILHSAGEGVYERTIWHPERHPVDLLALTTHPAGVLGASKKFCSPRCWVRLVPETKPCFPRALVRPNCIIVCVSRPPGAARCWLAGPLGPTPLKSLPATHNPQKKWEMRRSLSGGGRSHLLPAASCAPGPNAHSQPQQGAREMYGDVIFFSNTDQRLYSFTINGLPPGKGGTPRTC